MSTGTQPSLNMTWCKPLEVEIWIQHYLVTWLPNSWRYVLIFPYNKAQWHTSFFEGKSTKLRDIMKFEADIIEYEWYYTNMSDFIEKVWYYKVHHYVAIQIQVLEWQNSTCIVPFLQNWGCSESLKLPSNYPFKYVV